jgi:hypothetical protein
MDLLKRFAQGELGPGRVEAVATALCHRATKQRAERLGTASGLQLDLRNLCNSRLK